MTNDEYCVICQRKLNPETMEQVGLNCSTGQYTLKEDLATQGWFSIGKDCLKKVPLMEDTE